MLTARGWTAIAAGVVAYAVSWGFGADVLVPLAIAFVAGPVVALIVVRRRETGPLRLTIGVAPTRPVEDTGCVLTARIIGRASRTGALRLRIGDAVVAAPLRSGDADGARAMIALDALPRGVHAVAQAELAGGDPFGFVRDRRDLDVAASIVVWPRWDEPVREPGGLDGDGEAMRARRRVQPLGYDLHGIREHAYGESLRRVDWKTTARTGRLMVREIEDDTGAGLAIVVDLDANLLDATTADDAVRAAATAVRGAMAVGDRAALILVGTRTERVALDGPSAWRQAMDALAAARADRSRSLAAIVDRDPTVLRADAITLVTAAAGASLDAVLGRIGPQVPVRVVRVGAASEALR